MESNYIQITQTMLQGARITLLVFFIVLAASIPLGFFITLLGRSKFKVIGWIINIYITVMRGTPLILQLFFVYFALPYVPVIGPHITLDRLPAALIAFTLNYAAYFAEIFRGGLMAIDKGQYEAAKVLGFNKIQTFIHIIIPQMIRVSLPALSNEAITLVKDTSLLYVISIAEISYVAKTAVSREASVFPLVIAGALYLLIILILTIILRFIEKKFSYASKSL
ncbi:MAG: amino acid ABC transporter permease [Candidatus Mucispirillum faecigallinarum]|nr:amino acid ABC transporter permease [Candidatus Mucispirillum faecigallinarum]